MDVSTFLRAILDDPADDTPRLVFADWLDDHGDLDRAEWIRAGVRLARLRPGNDGYAAVGDHMAALRRCRPGWWESLPGVSEQVDRGLVRLELDSKTAAARLGKAAWLPDLLAGGWLECVAVSRDDGAIGAAVAKWPAALRAVPLAVKPLPQVGDAGLAFWLTVPHLRGLDLPGYAARHPAARLLAGRADLSDLTLDGMSADADVPALFADVGRLSGLRRLAVKGNRQPTDADLAPLAARVGLREWVLDGCRGVTDAALDLAAGLPALQRLTVRQCPGVTAAGVERFQHARPAVLVERV